MHQRIRSIKVFTLLSRLCDGRRFKFGYDRKKRRKLAVASVIFTINLLKYPYIMDWTP